MPNASASHIVTNTRHVNGTATGVNTGLVSFISNPNRRKDLHDTSAEPDQEFKRICQESGYAPHEHQDMPQKGVLEEDYRRCEDQYASNKAAFQSFEQAMDFDNRDGR